jgi:hypothetical protein
MGMQSASISSRKDRGIAATALIAGLLVLGPCHATYARQASADKARKPPDWTRKAPLPDAKPAGDPKTGLVKPPDIDPKMAKKVPEVDPGMTQPPPDKQAAQPH